MDTAFHRRFKFIMEFPTPDAPTRTALWRQLTPKEAPLAPDVDFSELVRPPSFLPSHSLPTF